jgi:tRNA(adenine34) deaminase
VGSDEDFMQVALEEAAKAPKHGDVPIGAVVVLDDQVVVRTHNERELRGDPTAHAEILALQQAAARQRTWRLEGASLYVTLEPCPMCAGAVVAARVSRLVYGPQDERAGAALSLYNIPQDPRLNHSVALTTGVLAADSQELLRSFFEARR